MKKIRFELITILIGILILTSGILQLVLIHQDKPTSLKSGIVVENTSKEYEDSLKLLNANFEAIEGRVENLEFELENIKASVKDWNGLFKNMLSGGK